MLRKINFFISFLFRKTNFILFVLLFPEFSHASSEKTGETSCKSSVIFTIDGGGTRGVIPIYLLKVLENKVGCSLVDKVDLWGGTSIGGIEVLALNKPHHEDPTRPAYSAEDILHLLQSS